MLVRVCGLISVCVIVKFKFVCVCLVARFAMCVLGEEGGSD